MNENRIAKIAEPNLPRLDKEIAKLNRRADKIGCPHVSYEILETNLVPDPFRLEQLIDEFKENDRYPTNEEIDRLPKIRQFVVEIIGDGPKMEDWKFVGTLDHYTLPGKVIVNTVPGESVPEEHWTAEANCDHCQKIRRRIETFVLEGVGKNEGEWMLVGRTCLKDFFGGNDPMFIVRFLNRIWNLIEELEGWGTPQTGSRYQHFYLSKEVLATTAAVIRSFGWLPRSRAGYGATPSSAHVTHALDRPVDDYEIEQWKAFRSTIDFDKEADAKEADAAIAWLKEQDASNEYISNLKLLEDEMFVPAKMIGYWCSLIAAYQRAMERLEYQKLQRKLNEYYGEVGTRTEIRVTCSDVQTTEGYYGPLSIHRMWTEEGHTLVWFGNTGEAKMKKGGEYKIRARIKKHEPYKKWKQTVLSRLHVVETLNG
jgi:hypothetical protein